MAFQSFGNLEAGTRFIFRGKFWIKTPDICTTDYIHYNAYRIVEAENNEPVAEVVLCDEATLVQPRTGLEPAAWAKDLETVPIRR